MHKIAKIKQKLCDELETYSALEKIDAQSLEMIDKFAHAIKNLDKIIYRDEMEQQMQQEYSGYNPMMRNPGNSYGGNSYGNQMGNPYYDNSMAYARGGNRDNMGRYSRENENMQSYDMNGQYNQRRM